MKSIKGLAVGLLFFSVGIFTPQVAYTSPLDYSFPELLERYETTDEILRQLELHRPIAPLETREMVELPPISDVIPFETKYIYDEFGHFMEVLTDETLAAFNEELMRRVNLEITPEFEAYASALGALVDIMMAIEYYNTHGYAPISPAFSGDHQIRRIANVLDSHDGLSFAQSTHVNSLGLDSQLLANGTSRPAFIPQSIDNTAWRDAFRHFSWNLNMARNVNLGSVVARIAGNNHEWAGILRGNNVSEAQAINMRRHLATEMSRNLATFNTFVDNDTLMDFWNNREGVLNSNMSGSPLQIFTSRWQSANIIGTRYNVGVPQHQVTPERRANIFTTRWHIHFQH